MLTVYQQKEIIIDRLVSAMNRANTTAKVCRSLRLFNKATLYYHKAAAYKNSVLMAKILEQQPNELTFENFPFIKNN
jgi:hypothetical protein